MGSWETNQGPTTWKHGRCVRLIMLALAQNQASRALTVRRLKAGEIARRRGASWPPLEGEKESESVELANPGPGFEREGKAEFIPRIT